MRRSPLTPILKHQTRRGSVAVGNTPGVTPPPVLGDSYSITSALLDGAWDVVIDWPYAYVTASNVDRLVIIDITDPTSMSIVGSVSDTALDLARALKKSGNYCFVAAGTATAITTVDVSTPATPTVVDSLVDATNINSAYDIDMNGSTIYCTSFGTTRRFSIIDASTPTALSLVGGIALTDTSQTVLYRNSSLCYVTANNQGGVRPIDISTPATPVQGSLVNSSGVNGTGSGLALNGTYLYATVVSGTASRRSIAVFDVSSGVSFSSQLGTTPTNPNCIERIGATDYFLIAGSGYVNVVDASSPASLTVIQSLEVNAGIAQQNIAIDAARGWCYVTEPSQDRFRAVRIV